MSLTSKSPRKVARWALEIGKQTLPDYRHRCSPRKFTQPQLLTCLVLKTFWNCDYRGTSERLADDPGLRALLELEEVPHYTTLDKALVRLIDQPGVAALLDAAVDHSPHPIEQAAVDSTGFEPTNRSPHCAAAMQRAKHRENKAQKPKQPFTKLGTLIDTRTHLIHSVHTSVGPRPDVDELRPLLERCKDAAWIDVLTADAGYDSEANHAYLRERLNITSVIPAKAGRPTTRAPTGKYRRLMRQAFPSEPYKRRPQVETVMSMIKRNLGNHTPSRTDAGRARDVMLKALTHNLMILRRHSRGFLQSRT